MIGSASAEKSASPRVAIVGAGLAGFSLAHRLALLGVDVSLVEKSRGPGGRCSTRQTPAGAFDHGPGAVQAAGSLFTQAIAGLPDASALGLNAWARRLAAASVPAGGEPAFKRLDLTAVAALEPEQAGESQVWWLRTAEGEVPGSAQRLGPFDAVVVAAPAEQARTLLQPSARLVQVLSPVRSAPCWTVMAAWPGELPQAHRLQRAGPAGDPLAVARAMNGSPPGRWVLQATADWSEANLDAAPAAVTARLLEALSARAGVRLAAPAWSAAHRWRYAQVTNPLQASYGWDASAQLGSVGDAWAAGPGDQPRAGIERAWLSAQALADAWLLGALKPT